MAVYGQDNWLTCLYSLVCGIERSFNSIEGKNETQKVIPIAGNFVHSSGRSLDPKLTRLKTSSRGADRDREGVELQIGGGKYEGTKQKAVIDFICDESSEERRRRVLQRDDEGKEDDGSKEDEESKEKETADDGEGGTLSFQSYEKVGDDMLLNLEWRTKFACENGQASGGSSSSGHWGFFTWLIIM